MITGKERVLCNRIREEEFQKELTGLFAKALKYKTQNVMGENSLFYSHGSSWQHHSERTPVQTGMKSHIAEQTVKAEDIVGLDPQALWGLIESMAESMSATMHRQMYEVVSEAASSVGNVVDGGGGPLTPELFLEALEKLEFGINKADGTVSMPSFHVGPEAFDRFQKLATADDPVIGAKIQDIIKRKSQDALERERQRKARFKGWPDS